MVHKENVKMLISGIVILIWPAVVFYLNFVEGMWTGTDYDWLGTIGSLFVLFLALWAIREGLTSSNKTSEKPTQSTRPSLVSTALYGL